jgi:hypothetical protein
LLIETAAQSSPQGAISASGSDVVAEAELNTTEAIQPIEAVGQNSQQGGVSVIGDPNLLEWLGQDAASGEKSAQTVAQLAAPINQDGGAAAAGYGVGDSRSGQFLLGLGDDTAIGTNDPDQAVQLVEAVQPARQTPD